MGIDALLSRLHVVNQNGKYWRAFCPSHEDVKPSLSVWIADDGRVCMKCFAGCTSRDILDKLGITWKEINDGQLPERKIEKIYNYTDENANMVYQVVRFTPKSFSYRRPDGDGWIWNLRDIDRYVYHYHSIAQSSADEPLWFVEGEKDADRLAKEGLLSTCICGGSNAPWFKSYSSQLTVAGKRKLVYVIADADKPGRAFAMNVAHRMAADGIANNIIIVDLYPDQENKCDVSDYLDEGHTVSELIDTAMSGVTGSVINVSLAPRTAKAEVTSTEPVPSTISADEVPF